MVAAVRWEWEAFLRPPKAAQIEKRSETLAVGPELSRGFEHFLGTGCQDESWCAVVQERIHAAEPGADGLWRVAVAQQQHDAIGGAKKSLRVRMGRALAPRPPTDGLGVSNIHGNSGEALAERVLEITRDVGEGGRDRAAVRRSVGDVQICVLGNSCRASKRLRHFVVRLSFLRHNHERSIRHLSQGG
jgi:hypothetical protein